MPISRRLEQILGIAAALWGMLVLAFFLFGPVYQTATSSSDGGSHMGTASGLQAGIQPITIMFFAFLTLLLIIIAVTAFQDGRGRRGYRGWLIAATAIFGAFCLVTILSIGILLAPGLICAIIASILAGTGAPNGVKAPGSW